MNNLYGNEKGHCCRKAFLLALLTACIIFIPFMIWDKGYFFFFGDFNVQQIPFYKLAHEAVRTGDIFWNWYTDLGANFIGSYSFYLLGSPFFWLTLPFPTSFVPHLMAPLFILKHACAAFTACIYLKRFVRNREAAVFGALLYAFSGFAVYNIFFNHFHEVIVFFPLLLAGLEELIVHNRRGLFALAVAINALVNYWFFIGEVVFVLLYFVIRSLSPDWKMNFKKFFWTGFEAVLGLLLASFIFLPSVVALLGNPRTGTDELLNGWSLWLYWHNQLYPAIVSSAFFPPDLPSRPNLFPDRGAKWASLSAWLPFISMSGILAYLKSKRDWLRRILLACFLIALVPALNSAFILFNNSYYARWYYMPILLMALASARAMETPSIDMRRGLLWTGAYTLTVVVLLTFTPVQREEEYTIGLMKYPGYFIAVAAVAILGLMAFALIWQSRHRQASFFRISTGALCFVSVVYTIAFIAMGKGHSDDTDFIRDIALDGRYLLADIGEFSTHLNGTDLPALSGPGAIAADGSGANASGASSISGIPDSASAAFGTSGAVDTEMPVDSEDTAAGIDSSRTFARSDLYDSMDNLGMYWHLPNIQAFHSVIPTSIMEFYPKVGVKRDVSSKPEIKYYQLRPLLSVRWLFEKESEKNQDLMPGYTLRYSELGYNIYENLYYIPMGFTYDYYITVRDFEEIPEEKRAAVLLRALVLKDEGEARHSDILEYMPEEYYTDLGESDYYVDCENRRATAGSAFLTDTRGFTSQISLPRENLVFYSVPYDKGWSATVNGVPAEIEKVDIGFMAVRAPAGDNVIRFTYVAPGLSIGILLSLLAAAALAVYLLLCRRYLKRHAAAVAAPDDFDPAYAADRDWREELDRSQLPENPFDIPEDVAGEIVDALLENAPEAQGEPDATPAEGPSASSSPASNANDTGAGSAAKNSAAKWRAPAAGKNAADADAKENKDNAQ